MDVKNGSLLQKLADREQTTSDDILQLATQPTTKQQTTIGPLTPTEELLEALDLAIGSEEDDVEDHGSGAPDPVLAQGETQDSSGETPESIPPKNVRMKKEEIQTTGEPKFVELTRLLPPVPKKGSFEVNSVKKSLYFFS